MKTTRARESFGLEGVLAVVIGPSFGFIAAAQEPQFPAAGSLPAAAAAGISADQMAKANNPLAPAWRDRRWNPA